MQFLASKINWLVKGEGGIAATLQTVFSRFFILAINLATGIITARVLGPEGRGEQAAIIFWPGLLASTFTLGLPLSIVYNFRRHPEKRSEMFGSALVLCSVLGLLASLTGYCLLPYILNQYSEQTIAFARIMVFVTISILLNLVLYGAYEGIQKFYMSNQALTLIAVMTLALLLLFSVSDNLNSYTSSIAYLVIHIPISVWLLISLWRTLKPKFKGILPSSKSLVSYGVRSYGIDLFNAVSDQINQALVVSALNPLEMGLFAISISFTNMLSIFRLSIVTVLLPKMAARSQKEVVEVTGLAARICAALTLGTGLLAIIVAPQLITFLYGADFIEAVILFRISVLEVLLTGVTLVLAQAFLSLNKPGIVTVLQATGLMAGIPLRLILIPAYGYVGAGVAILLSSIIRFVLIIACFPILLKCRVPNLLITKADIVYLAKNVFKTT
ncbi:MAG: oligosaccharide flippase family protein [Cyanobacteria bacterium P01_D01_bin.105]